MCFQSTVCVTCDDSLWNSKTQALCVECQGPSQDKAWGTESDIDMLQASFEASGPSELAAPAVMTMQEFIAAARLLAGPSECLTSIF